MNAGTILDRPEFAVLRRLDADQLGRIRPRLAERRAVTACPMAQALGEDVGGGYSLAVLLNRRVPRHDALSPRAFGILKREAYAFVEAWDGDAMGVEDLEAAVAAVLAEREGTP